MDAAACALSMGVTGGLIALAAALLVATVLGVALRRAVGLPRKADVIAAPGSAIPGPGEHGSQE
jgi:hypothetical protein